MNTNVTVLPQAPQAPQGQVASWRLLTTMGGAGAAAGLFIVLAFGWTSPRIEENRASVLRGAIAEVLHAPVRADTLYLQGGALVTSAPAGKTKVERVYVGYDAQGQEMGYAITASEAGFADQIVLVFGYNPTTREVMGMKVLASKETPGLGDKIERPAFTAQFKSRTAPLVGVKSEAPGDANAVVMITGATISSRTVIREINNAITKWHPLIEQYQRGKD